MVRGRHVLPNIVAPVRALRAWALSGASRFGGFAWFAPGNNNLAAGVFEDITGEGTITGTFSCLGTRDCGDLGLLTDAAFALQGTFSDPTT